MSKEELAYDVVIVGIISSLNLMGKLRLIDSLPLPFKPQNIIWMPPEGESGHHYGNINHNYLIQLIKNLKLLDKVYTSYYRK
ncbi:MAG: hypothetical protein K2W92_09750 [Alphaproteobacteria bacterium]|nr:hypothetical protein [Alphaproteobacteria bacterium]